MYLSKNFSEAHKVCSVWLGQEARTQELSETDSIRGAKLEIGILGVVVPLMDGVFSPYAADTSAPRSGSPRVGQSMSEFPFADRKQAYHEATSVTH